MADVLRMDYINSLPQPFMATFCGGDEWPVHDIEVQVALLRIDVVGLFEVRDFCDVMHLTDADGNKHDSDIFYCDYDT